MTNSNALIMLWKRQRTNNGDNENNVRSSCGWNVRISLHCIVN
jgi:hypothetical protein